MLSDRRGPLERFVIFSGGRALAGACAGLGAMAVPATIVGVGLGHLLAEAIAAALAAAAVEFSVTARHPVGEAPHPAGRALARWHGCTRS